MGARENIDPNAPAAWLLCALALRADEIASLASSR